MVTNGSVFVVDDDPEVRDSLRWLLESADLAVETYPSAEALLEEGDVSRCDCLLLDVRMPGMGGLSLQRELVASGVAPPIIFISAYGDVPLAVRACKAGAVDFLTKPCDHNVLLRRVRETLARSQATREQDDEVTGFSARLQTLTPREREILTLVVAGKTSKAISADLGVSHRTVEVHRARLMGKLGVDSVALLVRLFLMASGVVAGSA